MERLNAIRLLFDLRDNDGTLGDTILWNAIYHLQLRDGVTSDVIPSFNHHWHSGDWWRT